MNDGKLKEVKSEIVISKHTNKCLTELLKYSGSNYGNI